MHPTQPHHSPFHHDPLINTQTHTIHHNIDSTKYPNQVIQTVITRSNPTQTHINQSKLINTKDIELKEKTIQYDSSSRIIYDKRNNQNSRVIQQQHYEISTVQQKSLAYKQPEKEPRESQHTPTLLSNETVPKIQYERCVSECKNWETKYNELYLKYMNLSTNNNEKEVEDLREENWKLCEIIKQYEEKERRMRETMEHTFDLFVKKYEESTAQECMLLVDRFRLQSQSK